MRYKVIFYDNNNTPENASFSFYTKSQAEAACSDWITRAGTYRAWLWDGSQWIKYYP